MDRKGIISKLVYIKQVRTQKQYRNITPQKSNNIKFHSSNLCKILILGSAVFFSNQACPKTMFFGPDNGGFESWKWVYLRFLAKNSFYGAGGWSISAREIKSGKMEARFIVPILDLFEAGRLFPITFEGNELFGGACQRAQSILGGR